MRRKINGQWVDAGGWNTTGLKSGICHLTLDALPDGTKVGDKLDYLIEATDPVRFDAFTMELMLDTLPQAVAAGAAVGRILVGAPGRRSTCLT